jgi:uncharacterized lipoprotein YddW (UPF0748 family)
VWLTNVASDALYSRANVEAAIARCDSLGFTDIYVVVWNDASTTFPSRTVEAVTGVAIQPEFAGRDPLAEVIAAGHARGIRVHAWFEFGFSSSIGRPEDGGPILQSRPHWAARDTAGAIASKNGFQWMNAFHPEVQQFMTDLITEVVDNYAVDGIQGDDRLPAQPSLAGYDAYTDSLYRSEHNGHPPPWDTKNSEWIDWRADRLNVYLHELTDHLRTRDPALILSMAPSIYPWSKEEYLQDWPTWLNSGWIDYAVPQVYRYELDRYEAELHKIVSEQVPEHTDLIYPGILLQVNDYNPSPELLDSMVGVNRSYDLDGEVYFFYEGIGKYPGFFTR